MLAYFGVGAIGGSVLSISFYVLHTSFLFFVASFGGGLSILSNVHRDRVRICSIPCEYIKRT